jgi:hypothetical protein
VNKKKEVGKMNRRNSMTVISNINIGIELRCVGFNGISMLKNKYDSPASKLAYLS